MVGKVKSIYYSDKWNYMLHIAPINITSPLGISQTQCNAQNKSNFDANMHMLDVSILIIKYTEKEVDLNAHYCF